MYVPLPLVFFASLAEVVVGVLDDRIVRAVGQFGQPAQGVVSVVDREAVLVDALGALALGRCR